MLISSNSINQPSKELCDYMINNLGISKGSLDLGVKRASKENSPLPIVMWSYGLITLQQLKLILSWQKDH